MPQITDIEVYDRNEGERPCLVTLLYDPNGTRVKQSQIRQLPYNKLAFSKAFNQISNLIK